MLQTNNKHIDKSESNLDKYSRRLQRITVEESQILIIAGLELAIAFELVKNQQETEEISDASLNAACLSVAIAHYLMGGRWSVTEMTFWHGTDRTDRQEAEYQMEDLTCKAMSNIVKCVKSIDNYVENRASSQVERIFWSRVLDHLSKAEILFRIHFDYSPMFAEEKNHEANFT
jgi:hypothetical protein